MIWIRRETLRASVCEEKLCICCVPPQELTASIRISTADTQTHAHTWKPCEQSAESQDEGSAGYAVVNSADV